MSFCGVRKHLRKMKNEELKDMSRMYLNQVSSRELFKGGRDKRHSQCSENNSQYMYQNSQREFSENSQDVNNSQPLSGELNGSESQGRRMFDRFMNTRTNSETSFKSTPAKQIFNPGTGGYNPGMSLPAKQPMRQNFQQQIISNKSKAKERDDRDMINTVVNTVKECSDEVKGSIRIFKSNMEQVSDTSNEKFAAMANSVFDALTENFDKILMTLKEKDEKRTSVNEMEKEISMRDAKIEQLKSMIERQQTEREKQLIEGLKIMIQSHHKETTEKLDRLRETTHHQTDNQHQLLDNHLEQKQIMEMHHEQCQNMQCMKHEEIKKGIISELQQVRQDLDNHKKQLEDFYTNQLSTSQYKSVKEMQYYLNTGFDKQLQQTRDNSREMCNYQMNQFTDISKSQHNAYERFIKAQMQEQAKLRRHENEHLTKQFEMLSSNKMNQENDTPVNHSIENDNQDIISQNLQNQLDEMHRKYTEELAKLREEVETQGPGKKDSVAMGASNSKKWQDVQPCKTSYLPVIEHKFQNSEDRRENRVFTERFNKPQYHSDKKHQNFAFVSPGYRADVWNGKSVFSKTNPSPVAAVLPQPHNNETQRCHENGLNTDRKKKGRRRKTYGEPSRKSQRLNRRGSDTENEASDASQKLETGLSMQSNNISQNTETNTDILLTQNLSKNIHKQYSDVFSRSYVKGKAVYGSQQPDKVSNLKRGDFTIPQSSQKSCNGGENISMTLPSRQSSSSTRPITTLTGSKLETARHCEYVVPIRPNTYSSLRKSTPSVAGSLQPNRRFSMHKNSAESVNNHKLWGQNSQKQQRVGSVYDFNDSPVLSDRFHKESTMRHNTHSSNRPGATWQRKTKYLEKIIKHREVTAELYLIQSESSRESSPSLSITKIMIQRKVRGHKRSQDFQNQQEGLQRQKPSKQEMPGDFLSTPNLEDNSNTSDNWEKQSVVSNYRRSGEKRKLFNFDLGQELFEIKKAFKV